jgi:pimeloyl-ACP methyl ester carboxylesterase
MKFVIIFVITSLAWLLGGCASIAQRAVLPGSYLKPPACTIPASADYELITLSTKTGTKIVALFGAALGKDGQPPPELSDRPTVLFFYGNQMSLAASRDIFADLRQMGVNVLIPEYPGYGMSEGKPSEKGCYEAADAAYAYLRQRADINQSKILIAGLSLGGGVAIDLANRERVAGLILVVPFANTRTVGHDNLPWYLRWTVPLLAPHAAFDNLAKIPRVSCPILFIQAKMDQLTSAKRSDELAAAITTETNRVTVEADHDGSWKLGRKEINDWLHTSFPTPKNTAVGKR